MLTPRMYGVRLHDKARDSFYDALNEHKIDAEAVYVRKSLNEDFDYVATVFIKDVMTPLVMGHREWCPWEPCL